MEPRIALVLHSHISHTCESSDAFTNNFTIDRMFIRNIRRFLSSPLSLARSKGERFPAISRRQAFPNGQLDGAETERGLLKEVARLADRADLPSRGQGVSRRSTRCQSLLPGITAGELTSPVGLICITVTSSFGLVVVILQSERDTSALEKQRRTEGYLSRPYHPRSASREAARTLITIITTGSRE